ncbi:MAG: hypothetical protein V1906_03060 [Candidatus Woesearchaeota archaeon]
MDIKEENIEEKQESPLKKSLIVVLGICMIFLFFSYTFYNNGNHEILLGMIGSATLEKNIIYLEGRTIEFEGRAFISLVEHYVANDGNEIKACLMGRKEENKIILSQIYFPRIYSSAFNSVKAEPCPKETLLSIHSHPNRRCMPSSQDMDNYEYMRLQSPDMMVAILCDTGRLYFYD